METITATDKSQVSSDNTAAEFGSDVSVRNILCFFCGEHDHKAADTEKYVYPECTEI